MDFVTAVKTCFRKYATFHGRAIRSEYWFFTLFHAIVYVVAAVIAGAAEGALTVLPIVTAIVFFVPGLAVWVRRLHDLDKSGGWSLIGLIPVMGAIVLLVWACGRGTRGANRFGADPLAGSP